MKKFYDVEEKVPLLQAVPLSLQHLFAMFGSTVLVPFLLHVNPATALFMNGIGTLLYLIICKGKLPAYLGSSFAFISPVLAVLATSGMSYGDAQGGFIAFGISFIILSFVVGKVGTNWIDVILPPAAMGAVVAVIGLELAPLALDMSGFVSNTMETQGIPNELAMITSVFTLGVAILASVIGRGFLSVIPVLIGVVAGYIMALCLGIVDLSAVENAPWIQVPTFYEPNFNFHAIMIIMPALFVVFAEHIGHVVVTSSIVNRDLIWRKKFCLLRRLQNGARHVSGADHSKTHSIIPICRIIQKRKYSNYSTTGEDMQGISDVFSFFVKLTQILW